MNYPEHYIAYGSQYYRAPTPLEKNWETDLKAAADAGFNTMKFWVQWRSNCVEEGKYDFSDVERLMDIAEKNHLKVILNTIFDGAPAWFERQYPDSCMVTANGRVMKPQLLAYRQIGGCPGPCLNHPEARRARYDFLYAAAKRLGPHPALLLWDLWNEPELTNGILRIPKEEDLLCYCDHCREAFIEWLREKYGDIVSLNDAWHGMFRCFEEISLPRGTGVPKPMVDWRLFFTDVCAREVEMRGNAVRNAGDGHPVMVHTVPMPYFNRITTGSDEYKLAKHCDLFGCSIASEPFSAALTASAALGKVCFAAEIHAMGGSTYARPARPTFAAFKKHVFVPLARGMKGFQYWQLRSEVLGHEAPAWGLMDLRGRTDTPQFDFARRINDALQANAADLAEAVPKPAEIAIINNEKMEVFDWVTSGSTDIHYRSLKGIFDAFYTSNRNADILSAQQAIEQPLDRYKLIAAPFPYYMERALAEKLREWVKNGGHLIAEAFFAGISDEDGCFSEMQPGFGFEEIFGAEEAYAYSSGTFRNAYSPDWTPEEVEKLRIPLQSEYGVSGFHFMQGFNVKEGTQVLAAFEDGTPAIVSRGYGRGRAVLAGTLLGYMASAENRRFLGKLAEQAGVEPNAVTAGEVRTDFLYQGEKCRFAVVAGNASEDCAEFRNPDLSKRSLVNVLTGEKYDADFDGNVLARVPHGEMELFKVEEKR